MQSPHWDARLGSLPPKVGVGAAEGACLNLAGTCSPTWPISASGQDPRQASDSVPFLQR